MEIVIKLTVFSLCLIGTVFSGQAVIANAKKDSAPDCIKMMFNLVLFFFVMYYVLAADSPEWLF